MIKCDRGVIEIEGTTHVILAELSCIIKSLLKEDVPADIILDSVNRPIKEREMLRIKAGKRYMINCDDNEKFTAGDIVIALGDNVDVPFCILEEHFTTVDECLYNPKIFDNYVWGVVDYCLDEIEESEEE